MKDDTFSKKDILRIRAVQRMPNIGGIRLWEGQDPRFSLCDLLDLADDKVNSNPWIACHYLPLTKGCGLEGKLEQ